jgi:uncharacterized DUF497 family protein
MGKLKFDWDKGNLMKSETKHGIFKDEAVSVFEDNQRVVYFDVKHSTKVESRYICIGKSNLERILFCYFTLRPERIRIIGCRIANKREQHEYEALKK